MQSEISPKLENRGIYSYENKNTMKKGYEMVWSFLLYATNFSIYSACRTETFSLHHQRSDFHCYVVLLRAQPGKYCRIGSSTLQLADSSVPGHCDCVLALATCYPYVHKSIGTIFSYVQYLNPGHPYYLCGS